MLKSSYIFKLKWELSLVVWIFCAASIGVVIRYLHEYFLLFQQVFLRSFIALLLSILIYSLFYGRNDFSKFVKRDYYIVVLRAVFHLWAITFWILALLNTSLANATLVWSIPATAILWIIFFWDRLWPRSLLFLCISIFGAFLLTYQWWLSLGLWELYAFVASFLFSSYSLLRKKFSHDIGDREISLVSLGSTSFLCFLVVIFYQPDFTKFYIHYDILSYVYVFLWAVIFLCISFFGAYWFKRVNSIKASSIEFLEIPFAIVLWFIFFGEVLNLKDAVWGVLIVTGAYLMLVQKSQ